MTRTDIHRPSQLIPADYEWVTSYACGTSGMPGYNIEIVIEHSRKAREAGRQIFGGSGSCGTCGAWFIEGDLWRHVPTGDLIHFGHQCADSIGFIQTTDQARERLRITKARQRDRENARMREQREAFLAGHPGLAEALEAPHHISADLSAKLTRYGSLSDRQVELAFRLQRQAAEQAERDAAEAAKPKALVPEGRLEIQGTVLGTKWKESYYGGSLKMLVEVETPEGFFKVWGTVPASLDEELRGAEVAFTATVEPSQDDPHFGFYKRPTKARVTRPAPEREDA